MCKETAIKSVVQMVGMRKLANHLGVTYQAIQRYLSDDKLPAEKVLMCAEAVNFKVTPHQLRPDLYPHPEDGLPTEYRCQCDSLVTPNLPPAHVVNGAPLNVSAHVVSE